MDFKTRKYSLAGAGKMNKYNLVDCNKLNKKLSTKTWEEIKPFLQECIIFLDDVKSIGVVKNDL